MARFLVTGVIARARGHLLSDQKHEVPLDAERIGWIEQGAGEAGRAVLVVEFHDGRCSAEIRLLPAFGPEGRLQARVEFVVNGENQLTASNVRAWIALQSHNCVGRI